MKKLGHDKSPEERASQGDVRSNHQCNIFAKENRQLHESKKRENYSSNANSMKSVHRASCIVAWSFRAYLS